MLFKEQPQRGGLVSVGRNGERPQRRRAKQSRTGWVSTYLPPRVSSGLSSTVDPVLPAPLVLYLLLPVPCRSTAQLKDVLRENRVRPAVLSPVRHEMPRAPRRRLQRALRHRLPRLPRDYIPTSRGRDLPGTHPHHLPAGNDRGLHGVSRAGWHVRVRRGDLFGAEGR